MTTPAIILGLLMAPLLIVGVISWLARSAIANPTLAGCLGITLVFLFTGVGHFIKTEPMAEMLPPWVPGRIPLVYISGVIEIVAAVAVLREKWRPLTGACLILMLLAFLPVNIYAAVNQIGMGGHQWGPVYLLIRIPLQAILLAWVWWFAVRTASGGSIRFSCEATLSLSPSEIAEQILDTTNWAEFQGYGLLPGIKAAEFEVRTPEVIGSRIRVQNTDGSSHVEEITEWEPERRIALKMQEFSAPLSRLATDIDEIWEFERVGNSTKAIRYFKLHARSVWTKPSLWLISFLLRRAIDRHLRQIGKR